MEEYEDLFTESTDRDQPQFAVVEPPRATVPMAFVDTETTHLHRRIRQVWEVGVVATSPSGRREEYAAIVEDVDLTGANPISLDIGGFHRRHPRGDNFEGTVPPGTLVLPQRRIARDLRDLLAGLHFWGAVPDFDEHSLWEMLWKHGYIDHGTGEAPWHYHLGDVETFAAGRLKLPPPWDFDQILAHVGLVYREEDRHVAIGDARMANQLYNAVLEG